jgi:uncharacterized protein (DUF2164 family)
MPEAKRSWDILPEESRIRYMKEIISYFGDERDEEIGVVAAQDILDFFLQNIGPEVYNRAIDDAKNIFRKQLEGLDIEFDLLKKQK